MLCLVAQLCPTLCNPMDCSPPGSSIHGIFQTRVLEWIAISFSRDLPNLGIESRSPAPWADSLLSGPPGKPMNTGVGSLSLLQGIFPAQEWNQDLLHHRRIESDMTEQLRLSLSFIHTPIHACTDYISVQFSHSVVSDSLRPHESQHARPPCPSPNPGVHSESRPSSQ